MPTSAPQVGVAAKAGDVKGVWTALSSPDLQMMDLDSGAGVRWVQLLLVLPQLRFCQETEM